MLFRIKLIPLFTAFFAIACQSSDKNKEIAPTEKVESTSKDSLLTLIPKTYNFGEVSKAQQKSIQTSFQITNNSNTVIYISQIDVSCECVTVSESPDSIMPGHSATLKATVDLTNQRGHLRKTIFVNYNDSSLCLLKISGDVLD